MSLVKVRFEEIKLATFYSILADKVSSHNTKLMLLCIRFVDGDSNIRDKFIQFFELKRITREYIQKIITDTLVFTLGLDFNGLVGHGYDGASNMSFCSRCTGSSQTKRPLRFFTPTVTVRCYFW